MSFVHLHVVGHDLTMGNVLRRVIQVDGLKFVFCWFFGVFLRRKVYFVNK